MTQWRVFLRNHAPDIAATDLLVAPTIGFDLLNAFIHLRKHVAMVTIKIREDRVRRLLGKSGHRLHKTPARSWIRQYYGAGYMISNERGEVVSGCCERQYTDKLDVTEAFALAAAAKAVPIS